ncbi:hypothetical protein DFH08DRAFT_977127 [Mycena albidolilacea]|uniref:Uncharacterized protein n=1 Tax=Mycena albidolilacea TaxID=1033008 RepID=A0AAD7E8S0_9AGAR|nr:hypothetical protein DFH08DRAFT_977127 [Mycena albidolilacea]
MFRTPTPAPPRLPSLSSQMFPRSACFRNVKFFITIILWLLGQGEDNIPIPRTTKIKYLSNNLASLNIKLSVEDPAAVRALAL